jgi:hypothetical protein
MAQPTTAKFGKMRIMLGEVSGTDPGPVAVAVLSNENPAMVTVAPTDITKFSDGQVVTIVGATGDMSAANGNHSISNVGNPVNTFLLIGVNLSGAAAPQTTGITADPPAGLDWFAPCGFTSKNCTISKNLAEVNIPDCDDPDAPIWIGRDVQSQTCTISGDGVAAAESVPDWDAAAMTTESIPMKVEIEFTGIGTKVIQGNFHLDSEAFAADAGGRVTLAINAQSDGQVSAVWNPV